MRIHEFELDTTQEERGNSLANQYFFYHSEDKILSAWIAREEEEKVLIRAYREQQKGSMRLIDIQEVLTPIESLEINTSGTLILLSKNGALYLSLEEGKIQFRASNLPTQIIKALEEEKPIFPGMNITDQVIIRNKKLIKYSATSKDYYGNLFFEESILYQSTIKKQLEQAATPLIIIGNSRFDSSLNLAKCTESDIFDMPIINFSMHYTHLSEAVYLVGWNKKQLQAVQVDFPKDKEDVIRIIDKDSIKFQNIALKDASTLCNDCSGRFVVLVDENLPYRFYCLQAK